MPYIAHVAVQLQNDESPNEKNVWHTIKKHKGIEYRWKFSDDLTYHVIAGVFEKPNDALRYMKQLYVTLFFSLLKEGFQINNAGCASYETRLCDDTITVEGYIGDEPFFFWNKYYQGGRIGPGVFEVEKSLDEFDEYKFLSASLKIIHESDLNFNNVDEYYFLYCREAQNFFNSIMLAESASEYGMKMTIYCGLLEHLSENKEKELEVLSVLDELIEYIDGTTLSKENKDSLKNFINSNRRMSARQKCLILCEKYAKERYGKYTCKKIINEAYGIRSAFSHGNDSENYYSECASNIKYVVLDVIKNYMREKELDAQKNIP